jgi:hypothetical protein
LEKLPTPVYSSDEESADESDEHSDGECPGQAMATELGQHLLTIAEILAELYKLSFRIRNAAGRMKSLKPTLYEEIDEVTKVDKFAIYGTYDLQHVEESFRQLRKAAMGPKARALEEENLGMHLVSRLANTITKRRRVLRYWERHSEKLKDVSNSEKEAMEMNRNMQGNLLTTEGVNLDVQAGQLTQRPKLVASVQSPSLMGQTILSGTEASRYKRKLDDSLDTQSLISYASEAIDINGNIVALPQPPAEASTKSEFLCPYCGIVCPSRLGKHRAWRYFYS